MAIPRDTLHTALEAFDGFKRLEGRAQELIVSKLAELLQIAKSGGASEVDSLARGLVAVQPELKTALSSLPPPPGPAYSLISLALTLPLFVYFFAVVSHTFKQVFVSIGISIPGLTLFTLRLSDLIRTFWPILLLAEVILLTAFVLHWIGKIPRSRRWEMGARLASYILILTIGVGLVSMVVPIITLVTGLSVRR